MIDGKELLRALRTQLRTLEADLRGSAGSRPAEDITQSACAWVLASVLVRFCEDNRLTDAPFIAGPGERLSLARDRQMAYFTRHPERTDREWIVESLDSLATSASTVHMFDSLHHMMQRHPISPSAARDLISFWRSVDETGQPVYDFGDPGLGTDFLGDLYADLSDHDRDAYALVQTPGFVTDFILDRTLVPAMNAGLSGLRIIDPVCGSGTFLLGAFWLLTEAWRRASPAAGPWGPVRAALASIHGVDKNPIAASICQFRLLVAAVQAGAAQRLSDVPKLPLVVVAGDSLIRRHETDLHGKPICGPEAGSGTDSDVGLLDCGSYDVVVGNPPYITVKDRVEQETYRSLYSVCRGRFSQTVPFIARFFELARPGGKRAGFVGLLVADSFMKREFGRPLVEDLLAHIDLTHVLDTSGAYIPGHGTPTVILLGRARPPRAPTIRTALGRRGEPTQLAIPADGVVWQALTRQIDHPGADSKWLQVADIERRRFAKHPWSLAVSQARDVLDILEAGSNRLGDVAARIGYYATTGSDDAFIAPAHVFRRSRAEPEVMATIVTGSDVRDWGVTPELRGFFPGKGDELAPDVARFPHYLRRLWPYRNVLRMRRFYGTQPFGAGGRSWYGWHQVTTTPDAHPRSLVFPWVATHTHFAAVGDGAAPLQSAPVVKLPGTASEEEFSGLLAVLNSSAACFWLKQHSHSKGAPSSDQLRAGESWEHIYEFTSTCLQDLPLPPHHPADRGRELDELARRLIQATPAELSAREIPTQDSLDDARAEHARIRGRMIALQEELDWDVYHRYGLITDGESAELVAKSRTVPNIELGQRAFEIVMARRIQRGDLETQWFARHQSVPITKIPDTWPEDYRKIVAKRIELIERNPHIAVIECPEYKRRWQSEPWEVKEKAALRTWLLDRCEERSLWHGPNGQPRPLTISRLADILRRDADVVAVVRLYAGPSADLFEVLDGILAEEHLPFLAAYRYRGEGLTKRRLWERAWDSQREEDRTGNRLKIDVPPKYKQADFHKQSYWRHRGKLDVPKERFISYPYASSGSDRSLLLGWAGWDHREQAWALMTLIEQRSSIDRWDTEKLVPLLAGLAEIMPWVRQWHGETDLAFAQSPVEALDDYLARQLARHALTEETLRAWTAPPARRGRPPKKR